MNELITFWDFLNSTFFTSLAGAAAGAWAGAWAAQSIADRSKMRDEGIRELNACNAAITIAHSICNMALALKKQHVIRIKSSFDATAAAFIKHQQDVEQGLLPRGTQLAATVELTSLDFHEVPTGILSTLIFEKIGASGRPVAALSTLVQSVQNLSEVLAKRRQLVDEFRQSELPTRNPEVFTTVYLGVPGPLGYVDRRFADSISGLAAYTDDVAYFSYLLGSDIAQLAQKLRRTMIDKRIKNLTRVIEIDYTVPRQLGLLPHDDQYKEWLKGFTSNTR